LADRLTIEFIGTENAERSGQSSSEFCTKVYSSMGRAWRVPGGYPAFGLDRQCESATQHARTVRFLDAVERTAAWNVSC
jgi:hypothetical protein